MRIVYVEDDAQDRERYARLLSSCENIEVVQLPPPEAVNTQLITDREPDVLLIDYMLDAKQPGGHRVNYRGLTLCAALREAMPETPILLLTRGSMLRKLPTTDVQGIFDEQVLKADVGGDISSFCDTVQRLAQGYEQLRGCRKKDWSSLIRVLGAQRDEKELLLKADSPDAIMENKVWKVPDVARWIRQVVITYPGILYEPLHASVLLGISAAGFLSKPVQRWFSDAKYGGPLAPREGRWWKKRLIERAHELLDKESMGELPLNEFRSAWRKRHRKELAPPECVSGTKGLPDCVCCVFRQPVKRRYSLAYRPDNRPAVMDEARISFKAIEETNEYDERLFPADARPIVREIQKRTGRR